MGYMTEISILNDGWNQIKNNPEQFIHAIDEGMDGLKRGYSGNLTHRFINHYGVGNHANCVAVSTSHHADDARLYLSFENSFYQVGWGNDEHNIEYRKRMLKIAKNMIKWEEEQIKTIEKGKLK